MATASQKSNSKNTSSHPVTDKVQDSLHDSVDTVAGKAAQAESSMRAKAAETADNMTERKRIAQEKWEGSAVRKYAVENPIATAGLAFAAGMLVTSLLKKSK